MSEAEDTFRRLKKEVESTQAEAQRAKGALDQLTHQLEEEFECSSVKEAEALLAELEEQKGKAERTFQKALKEYERKWKQNES